MNNLINLSKEKFACFMDIIELMKDACDYCIIKDGIIRQFDNSAKFIFEIDIKKLVGESNISLSNLNDKYKLLDPFQTSESAVIIELLEKSYEFKDTFSKITFLKPLALVSNKFITESAFNNIFISNDDKKILDINIKNFILSRLKCYKDVMDTNNIKIEFDDKFIRFYVSPTDESVNKNKKSHTVSELIKIENNSEIRSGWLGCPIYPLLINKENIRLRLYEGNKVGDPIIISIDTKFGRDDNEREVNMKSLAKLLIE